MAEFSARSQELARQLRAKAESNLSKSKSTSSSRRIANGALSLKKSGK